MRAESILDGLDALILHALQILLHGLKLLRSMALPVLHFASPEDLEQIIAMGFKEGYTMGLQQLEELLAANPE